MAQTPLLVRRPINAQRLQLRERASNRTRVMDGLRIGLRARESYRERHPHEDENEDE